VTGAPRALVEAVWAASEELGGFHHVGNHRSNHARRSGDRESSQNFATPSR